MPEISGTPLITVVGSRGGIGTSTLAATMALLASERESVGLIDGSPRNGLELLLGHDDHEGPFWQSPDYRPHHESDLSILAWRDRTEISEGAASEMVDAMRSTHSLLIADAGTLQSRTEEIVARSSSAFVFLVPGEVRAITFAAHLAPSLTRIAAVHLVVVRPSPTGIADDELADLLNLPIAGVLEREGRLAVRGEHAQLPTRGLRSTARSVLQALGLG